MKWRVEVAVQTPGHSALGDTLSYASPVPVAPGALVRVPLGKREILGLAMQCIAAAADDAPAAPDPGARAAGGMALRPIAGVLEGLPPLNEAWRDLVAFAARYYQRALGEVALAALPPQLRELSPVQLTRRLRRPRAAAVPAPAADAPAQVALSADQAGVLDRVDAEPGPFLLHGATGSGKTEVYLRAVAALLSCEPDAQALVMVPEINLTPQLEARFAERFGAGALVSLHSGMTNPQRLAAWLAAHGGAARIVLGTRMAVFASLPRLRLIVVDEEHDPSYKQQEGARYSARDLALWRGRREGAKVLLGSATPSLESWHHSRPASADDAGGRYLRLAMPSRIGAGALPAVRLVDMKLQPPRRAAGAAAAGGDRCSASPAASRAWCCSTGAATPRCWPAATATGRASARIAAPTACSTRSIARCAATTADWPSACRAPARPAATRTSRRSGAAPSGWRNSWPNCWPACGGPMAAQCACCGSTPTARATRARWRSSWRRCTAAKSTCCWARR